MFRLILAVTLVLISSKARAGDQDKPAARLRSPLGTLFQKGPDKTWKTPALYDGVPAGVDLVVLPGARAVLELQEGDGRLTLVGNLPELSPSPLLECALRLHHPAGHDLDLSLDRGRILIENLKETGSSKVRIRLDKGHLDVELLDKTTAVALELFSRWPEGAPFLKKPKAGHQPVGTLVLLLLKGKAALELNKEKQTLQGPALFRFTTQGGMEGPLPLKNQPEWVKPGSDKSDKAKAWHTAVEKLRRSSAGQEPAKAIAATLKDANDATLRQVATYAALALDDSAAAAAALQDPISKETRRAAITGLTHFIGRGAQEDLKLYQSLTASGLKPGAAAIVMELLHGFGQQARARPETYDALITYLQSDQIAIRELAAWNLYRLVLQGKDISYDAGAEANQRAQAQAAWRKLVPEGQVPR